ncbi:MAG: S1 RNA-binding domain-containing protein [Zoogloea sp.]|nr:S1 RNA-binding domain-containing protein [Zoogloea sp.]
MTDVVAVDDEVEFVLLERSKVKADEWIVSLATVAEARVRQALTRLNIDDVLQGIVINLTDRYAELDCDGIPARVPLAEVSWGRIRHPNDVLRLHQGCKGKVLHVQLPDEWLTKKSARNAHAIISIRACNSYPESPLVDAPFSGQPFLLWVEPKKPQDCDAVVLYVLEEMGKDYPLQDIGKITGLPNATLHAIVALLERKGLASDSRLTPRGEKLARSIWKARAENDNPIRGVFASAAPAQEQFHRCVDESSQPEYPRSWPRPSFSRQAEDLFARATDEALPTQLIARVAGNERQSMLAALQADDGLRVFLRRDGKRPWRALWLKVPEYWILAGMWRAFEPVGPPPFCPTDMPDHCRNFLLVRLNVEIEEQGQLIPRTFYLEPWTRTCWSMKNTRLVREVVRHHSAFPPLPDASALGLAEQQDRCLRVTPSWVAVEVKA